ncbi:hypothetical protein [Virgibacillus litoralis]|uniref:Membrane protein n=1 Tax=Virgibacillus litoralis TaxID=578221 RepID=A0ABS4HFJ2_9BACI|nr:hypothetical protein [Virgibacillus litoralis]MBP1949692.1 putative membrane protein [Virgibacillus litoralis]
MLSNVLWGIFLVIFISFMIFLDKRKKKRRSNNPHREKTEQEKETEIAVEKERGRRPFGGGGAM